MHYMNLRLTYLLTCPLLLWLPSTNILHSLPLPNEARHSMKSTTNCCLLNRAPKKGTDSNLAVTLTNLDNFS